MSKKKSNINYKKIKRDLMLKDNAHDGRFVEKVVVPKKHKKEKHKKNYLDETD